jgi:excinuclease UvrABC ATPase subunit
MRTEEPMKKINESVVKLFEDWLMFAISQVEKELKVNESDSLQLHIALGYVKTYINNQIFRDTFQTDKRIAFIADKSKAVIDGVEFKNETLQIKLRGAIKCGLLLCLEHSKAEEYFETASNIKKLMIGMELIKEE